MSWFSLMLCQLLYLREFAEIKVRFPPWSLYGSVAVQSTHVLLLVLFSTMAVPIFLSGNTKFVSDGEISRQS